MNNTPWNIHFLDKQTFHSQYQYTSIIILITWILQTIDHSLHIQNAIVSHIPLHPVQQKAFWTEEDLHCVQDNFFEHNRICHPYRHSLHLSISSSLWHLEQNLKPWYSANGKTLQCWNTTIHRNMADNTQWPLYEEPKKWDWWSLRYAEKPQYPNHRRVVIVL